ncbi:ABC transporter ATP-binding protein [Fulvivirgaceae bacterium BMA12]|uniref:ABC transporter ATP-binding protein n=1 Tax=Agaribacillus aureus TaxID=3051825 RepID=A0ABT8LHI5_9BACT|nr:ABC transporter ATP-binding protein [Fulvivirgaceae bacterium BMA12]
MKALQIEHLSKTFLKREGPAISDISLDVEVGEILALLGESGSGKTTLLRLIAGLDYPDQGTIAIGDDVVVDDKIFIKPEKRKVGLVFQNHALFPHYNVFDNVAFGLSWLTKQDKARKVNELLTLVNLEEMENRFPHQLSGGQQQRVALARALAPRPEIVLLDEPFSNLDNVLKNQVREEVKKILKKAGATAIFVTHDTTDALLAADKIALMHRGKVLQIGSPIDIYQNPANENVGKFFGKINTLTLNKRENGWLSELGQLASVPQSWEGDQLKIIFRAENVTLTSGKEPGFKGQLVASHFMGDHCLLTVALADTASQSHLLYIKASANHGYKVDSTVTFQIDFARAKII